MRTKFELAGVIRQFGNEFLKSHLLPGLHLKALNNIVRCRTAVLGGHEEKCDCCGKTRYSYNSCGDRHCPKCQPAKQALWVDALLQNTLPVKHYHIIFTVPHLLNNICMFNPRLYYNLLFDAAWRTLHAFGYTHYGVETGALCMLHSWGQNLSLHPHIHCLVPAAGYSLKGEWINIGKYKDFLYPVNQLSDSFKGCFLDSLKRRLRKRGLYANFSQFIQQAWMTNWVVDCEPSLAKADRVIRYLGQYTHRVAISNDRILDITDTHVKFIAKDYRDRAIKKPVSLPGVEFLRRFCQHILPYRFVKIRYFGIYNKTVKRNLNLRFGNEPVPVTSKTAKTKEKVISETTRERFLRLTGIDFCKCPYCKKGTMVRVRELPRVRSPGVSCLLQNNVRV
jgi:hypothetical protein